MFNVDVHVFLRGVTPAVNRAALFVIFYHMVKLGIVNISPNMDTVTY